MKIYKECTSKPYSFLTIDTHNPLVSLCVLEKKLKNHKRRNNKTKQKKITVLKYASLLYDELVNICKKEYDQNFESKDEN